MNNREVRIANLNEPAMDCTNLTRMLHQKNSGLTAPELRKEAKSLFGGSHLGCK